MHRTRNAAYGQPYRGFESPPLRQFWSIARLEEMIRIIGGTKKATPVPQRQEANLRQEAVAAPSSLSQSVPVAGGQAAPRRRRSTSRNPEGRSPRQSIATRTGRSSPHSSSTGAGIDRYGLAETRGR